MTREELTEGNNLIASFMGWFTEEHQKGTWFVIDEPSVYVAYSIHNNYPHTDLPFHRDWNWLMKVTDKCWERQGQFEQGLDYFDDITIFSPIEDVWGACVEFIKYYSKRWYGEQLEILNSAPNIL